METGTSRTRNGCVTSAPPSQLRVMIVVKLFDCFDAAVGRNINKRSRICGPPIVIKLIFSVILLTCMDNYIWQFLIYTGVGFTV